ncbi:MAG: spondin domain-containing protein, partial [Actinomycetota bacterium]
MTDTARDLRNGGMRMRAALQTVGTALAMAALALAFVVPASASAPERRYRVTITNLTGGQPLTPVAVATHRTSVDAFTVGEPASLGVKEIAENGNLGPFVSSLQGATGVSEVVQGSFPLVPEGTPGAAMFPDSVTFEIHATPDARRLSWV